MKIDVWKNIVSQISYFRFRPDPMTLGEVGGGEPKILENAVSEGIRMKLGGKNNQKT